MQHYSNFSSFTQCFNEHPQELLINNFYSYFTMEIIIIITFFKN